MLTGCCLFALLLAPALVQEPEPGATLVVDVRDENGGSLPGASVELLGDGAARARRLFTSDDEGHLAIASVLPGTYRIRVSLEGFEPHERILIVGMQFPTPIDVTLAIASVHEEVAVHGSTSRIELTSTPHTTLDRQTIDALPSDSVSSGLSSLITLASPGVAADSNGVFHPLGEHAETSFIIDHQPISDQQSRIFSNQLSPNAIQSIEVITGVPPAEYGDKTSLVADVITRSGLALRRAAGSAALGFGSFGTGTASFTIGRGTDRFGHFLSIDGITSRRFLDTPEFEPLHADGGVANVFDRLDVHPSFKTHLQVNLLAAYSSFQTPNTYEQTYAHQDQRQHQHTTNVAGSLKRVLGSMAVLDANIWWRRDRVAYEGSSDLFADQPAALGQHRSLANAGSKTVLSIATAHHTVKLGTQQTSTWLAEQFQTGITSPTFNTPCLTAIGDPLPDPSLRTMEACEGIGAIANPDFQQGLLPIDLTRGGSLFNFDASTRISQWSAYLQDIASAGAWGVVAGLRFDWYDGLSRSTGVQPRVAVTYRSAITQTVWRASYGRIFLTPYNENLVLAGSTGAGGLAGSAPGGESGAALTPGRRDQYDIGLQQDLRRGLRIDADYFWKVTEGAYDFDVILNTPLTFPMQFRQAKIDGGLVRLTLPSFGGVTAYTTLSHTRARLFGPAVGGLRLRGSYAPVARPDHDEPLQANTHLEYRTSKWAGFWAGLTWRYDSGLVAVSVPTYADALRLTGDEQAAMGLSCGPVPATVSHPIRVCAEEALGASRIRIPPRGTENDDTNPPRIAPRHLIHAALGVDSLHVHGLRWSTRVTVVNLFNATALYNFLSTFSGTHFVTPRTLQGEISLRF
jgi:hypothetical protein